MIRRWIGLNCVAVLAALGVSGCIVEITLDPLGTDATMAGAWTIEGAAPTETSCAALGITNMKVRFYDGALTYDHPELVYPCTDGMFDTRPNAVVRDGVWEIALVAVNAAGDTIAESAHATYDTIAVGGHIQLPTLDFSATMMATAVQGTWTVNGATPSAASCATIGATHIQVQLLDEAGAAEGAPVELACAAGAFRIEDITPGAHSVQLAAVAADGVIAMSEPQPFTVTEGMTATIQAIDFSAAAFDAHGADAAFKTTWMIGGSADPIAEQCAAVGATKVSLMFYATSDTARETPSTFDLGACDAGSYDSVEPALAAGDYLIDAVLTDSAGTVISTTQLNTLAVTAGTPLQLGAIDFRLAASTIVAHIVWESSTTPGTFGSCTDAGVSMMNWQLTPSGSTTPAAMGDGIACANTLEIDAATLTAGTYILNFEESNKMWQASSTMTCEATVGATAGSLDVLHCQADHV